MELQTDTHPKRIHSHIPANIFSVECVIFRLYRTWISEGLPTASEDCRRYLTTSKDCRRFPDSFRRLPKISRWLPKMTEGVERFSTSKQGQRFPKDFHSISSIIKNWIFISLVSKQLHSPVVVRRETLFWMCEIIILDPHSAGRETHA